MFTTQHVGRLLSSPFEYRRRSTGWNPRRCITFTEMPPSFLFNWMRKTGPFLTHVDPFHRKMVRNQKLGHFVVRLDRSFSTRFEKLTRFKLNGFQSPFWPFSIEKKVTQNVLFETRSHRFLVNKISIKTKQNKTKKKRNYLQMTKTWKALGWFPKTNQHRQIGYRLDRFSAFS